jgi:hypothetical protein
MSSSKSVEVKRFLAKVAPWVPKLGTGALLGERKEALILEILELEGLKLLEERTGLRFTLRQEHPNCEPTMKTLREIKTELESKQARSRRLAADVIRGTEAQASAEKGGSIYVMTKLTLADKRSRGAKS